jgi:hypothetical protein
MHVDMLGLPCKLPFAARVLQFPTSSFFVSTEITGWVTR